MGPSAAEARLERQRVIEEILADVPADKAKLRAEVRAEYPDMTEEQLDAAWGVVALLFGLE